MTMISDLPHDVRFMRRLEVEQDGSGVEGYNRQYIQAVLPNPPWPTIRRLAAAGWALKDLFFFPLGTDKYPDHLRHDGSYPGSRGFTMHANLVPPEIARELGPAEMAELMCPPRP